jgi:uncharacterized protein (DUF58 family)
MSPYLTAAGRALLVSAILFVVAGTVGKQWALIALGAVQVGVLALAYYGLLRATLALERRLLAVEVEPPDPSRERPLLVGAPAALHLRITNRAGARLRRLRLHPHLSAGLQLTQSVPSPLELPPYSQLECKLEVSTQETGRWMLHGFRVVVEDALGLLAVGEYVGAPTPLKFAPEVGVVRGRGGARALVRGLDREGVHRVRHRGAGMELREMREHQPGDPFRSIEWKATARAGRLMVKEVESEFVHNTYLCLDISSTMRGGRSGDPSQVATKLEHALRLTLGLAHLRQAAGDRVGLITFDEKVHGHLRPQEGKRQLGLMTQHLIGLRHVIDEDLTEYGEHEVAELLARYLMIQERLDFRRQSPRKVIKGVGQGLDYWSFSRDLIEPEQGAYDLELLEQWVRAALPDEEARHHDPCLDTGVLHYAQSSPLRRFCHLRGLDVPYRVEARLGQKERGLAQCLEEILAHARGVHSVVIISDLCGIMNMELITRSLRAVKARHHKLSFLSPFTPDYATQASGRAALLHELFALAETDDRAGVVRAVQAMGIPVVPLSPRDGLSYALQRLRL